MASLSPRPPWCPERGILRGGSIRPDGGHHRSPRGSRVKATRSAGVRHPRLPWSLIAWGLAIIPLAHAVAIDMAEVRRLAGQPVRMILRDTAVTEITDADYRPKVQGSPRPVIVVFYADRDEKSRNLATLARYLAADFAAKITFYGYRASDGNQVDRPTAQRLGKDYGVEQIPATLFYDNDRGHIELERTHYDVPTLTEYRTPSILFFKTYYSRVHEYITKHILD